MGGTGIPACAKYRQECLYHTCNKFYYSSSENLIFLTIFTKNRECTPKEPFTISTGSKVLSYICSDAERTSIPVNFPDASTSIVMSSSISLQRTFSVIIIISPSSSTYTTTTSSVDKSFQANHFYKNLETEIGKGVLFTILYFSLSACCLWSSPIFN